MTGQAEEIAAVFGRGAPTYDQVVPFFTSFGRRLVDAARLAPGERVLDVGCGRGATLFRAADTVGPTGQVLGIDLSDEMVALTRAGIAERGIGNTSVRRMDAGALDLESESFDAVVTSFVLHLVPDPPAPRSGVSSVRVGAARLRSRRGLVRAGTSSSG